MILGTADTRTKVETCFFIFGLPCGFRACKEDPFSILLNLSTQSFNRSCQRVMLEIIGISLRICGCSISLTLFSPNFSQYTPYICA
jgi:hypothetical protein